MKTLAVVACLIMFVGTAFAHSGGTDGDGCHTNRKTGDYHCHNGSKASKAKTGSEKQASKTPPSNPGRPTCHVGPRGGTYTITKSGRKNYSGC